MQITVVRHTSVAVRKGTCYGWSDVPVAATFEQEAAATKQELDAIIARQGCPFDVVYSSPLTRALLLADACGYASPIVDDRLKEMNMGSWEMRRFADIELEDPQIHRWYRDYLHEPTTGGESFPLFYHRVSAFYNELRLQPYRHVAIFAHGGVLACTAVYAGRFTTEEAFTDLVPFGGIRQYEI